MTTLPAVRVSNLDYKKHITDLVPALPNVIQVVTFGGQLIAVQENGNVQRLNSSGTAWDDISGTDPEIVGEDKSIRTNFLFPDGLNLYAGAVTGMYLWNGNGNWELLGGEDGRVNIKKLITFSGFIHSISRTSVSNYIVRRWTGSIWSITGVLTEDVEDIIVFNDQLYASTLTAVRRWTGTTWANVGTISSPKYFIIFEGQLHVSSSITQNGSTQYRVSRWTGSSWAVLSGLLFDSEVVSMALLKGYLYATTSSKVYKRLRGDWFEMASETSIRSIFPIGPVMLLCLQDSNLKRLSPATFSFVQSTGKVRVDLVGHGLAVNRIVYIKCITGGFVSRTFNISSSQTDDFTIDSPTFVVREGLNYDLNGTTLTIHYPGHGLSTSGLIRITNSAELGFGLPSPLSVTKIDDDSFSVSIVIFGNTPAPGVARVNLETLSGEVLVSELDFGDPLLTSTISRNSSTGVVTINRTNHGYAVGNSIYVDLVTPTPGFSSSPAIVESVIGPSSFRLVKKQDPGSFYTKYGVKEFHDRKIYGRSVSVYIIDEGFNDVDPNIPGIQPISDLANFEVINISDEGAGTSISHGGLVGALLGASRVNGSGIIGVCPDAKLYLADVDDVDGSIFISNVVRAIDDAILRGVDIINMSLGTSFASSTLNQAVQRAVDANILVFASAGNSGSPIYEYPAAFDGVISVASVDYKGDPSSFNTRNEKVAIFAPGERYPLPSPVSERNIVYVDGTSFSCPYAAGLTALYIHEQRSLRGDPSWRPTREEIVEEIPKILGTQDLSYPAPGFVPVDLFGSEVVGTLTIAAIGLVVVFVIAYILSRIFK